MEANRHQTEGAYQGRTRSIDPRGVKTQIPRSVTLEGAGQNGKRCLPQRCDHGSKLYRPQHAMFDFYVLLNAPWTAQREERAFGLIPAFSQGLSKADLTDEQLRCCKLLSARCSEIALCAGVAASRRSSGRRGRKIIGQEIADRKSSTDRIGGLPRQTVATCTGNPGAGITTIDFRRDWRLESAEAAQLEISRMPILATWCFESDDPLAVVLNAALTLALSTYLVAPAEGRTGVGG